VSRVIRLTPWRILTRHARPYVEPERWSTLGVRPGALIVAVGLALVIGLLIGASVRGAVSRQPSSVASESRDIGATAPPTAGPFPRLARWPVEPVERPSPPTPSAAVEPTGARSEPSRPARSGHSVSGWATWYATGPDCLCAAAGPALRVGDWRGRWVTVNGWLRVRLIDWCACGPRKGIPTVIDLSDEAFSQVAPLGRGVVAVKVSW